MTVFQLETSYCLPNTLDRDPNGGRIMLYIREDISLNLLATDKEHIESLYVELNLWN